MKNEIDAIDKRILQLLRTDAKMTIKEIASHLGITATPVYERIKRLENDDYIKGYVTVINEDKLGYSLVAYCSVNLESHSKKFLLQFVHDIKKLDEVAECYHIAGMFDYLLKIIVRDMEGYQNFITHKLASIPNIGKVQSSFVMEEVKKERVYNFN